MNDRPLAERIAGNLSPYLGKFNAQIALKTFSQRACSLPPEELTPEHVPALLEALRPMLKTLAGQAATETIVRSIRRQVK